MEHTATETNALRNELHNDNRVLHSKLNLLLNKHIRRAYKNKDFEIHKSTPIQQQHNICKGSVESLNKISKKRTLWKQSKCNLQHYKNNLNETMWKLCRWNPNFYKHISTTDTKTLLMSKELKQKNGGHYTVLLSLQLRALWHDLFLKL